MEQTLLTTRGRRLYKQRGQTVEPVFGQIKSVWGCDRLMRRGTAACASEGKLHYATHNLLKLWRSGQTVWTGRRTAPPAAWPRKREEYRGRPLSKPPLPYGLSTKRHRVAPQRLFGGPDSLIMGLSIRLKCLRKGVS